ncbi:MAG: hypothetical protein IH600_17575 [Bacteroidetes bacterium]|nr:hypothetical protein [Bacteroidota bacterium]
MNARMVRLVYTVAILLLFVGNTAISQSFVEFDAPRYAESIRLASSYTGVARGLAAVQHNPAGLAFQSGFAGTFSSNTGALLFRYNFENIYNAAAAGHIESWGTTIAVTHSRVDFQQAEVWANMDTAYHPPTRWDSRLTTAHVAVKVGHLFSVGASLYNYSAERTSDGPSREDGYRFGTKNTIDLGLSVFGRHTGLFFSDKSDQFNYGINLQNVQGSAIVWDSWTFTEHLHQYLRSGIAYIWRAPVGTLLERDALHIMLASDLTLVGSSYDFTRAKYSAALEFTVAEMLMFSVGGEDEEQLTAAKWEVPTTLRYGFGVIIPVGEFVDLGQRLDIQFDYARSEFTRTDDLERDALNYTDPVAMSATLRWVP